MRSGPHRAECGLALAVLFDCPRRCSDGQPGRFFVPDFGFTGALRSLI
jgi:hypothetical protein